MKIYFYNSWKDFTTSFFEFDLILIRYSKAKGYYKSLEISLIGFCITIEF